MNETPTWYDFLPDGIKAIVETYEEEFVSEQLQVMFRGMVKSVYQAGQDEEKKVRQRVDRINQ